ncbi:hypothetical protein D6764_04545 [Candidatus Woesearchaeota archaeon]|nr:MAG: hypothetical protein D6764_04545 [Candidatus Woesearchaeota archaeon]
MGWEVIYSRKRLPKLQNAVLIEGMPGIGNVGKVTVDFIIDELKAKKLATFFSHSLPHSVFVNEKNLVELPTIELYFKERKGKQRDLLFLTGDVQPIDEQSTYSFVEKVLDIAQEFNVTEIIAVGGIGLPTEPKSPQVYCTGNNKELVEKYVKTTKVNQKLYGIVGPIVGVTGLLLGLSERREMPAVGLLAETYGHPMYLGITGAREVVKVINRKLGLKLNISELDKEIREIEAEMMKKTEELGSVSKQSAINRLQGKLGDMNYIG